jgi:hypothetical protein
MALAIGSRLGPYEIVSALGAGGMGEVYRARDTKLNRGVAIKVLPAALAGDRERLVRFEHEAQVLALLTGTAGDGQRLHARRAALAAMTVAVIATGTARRQRDWGFVARAASAEVVTATVMRKRATLASGGRLARSLRGFERLSDLLSDSECFIDRNLAACDSPVQALAVDEFEHEELLAVRFIETVDRADVRMVQRREDLSFTTKAREPLGIIRERGGQDLQRNVATELGVASAIDLTHAPGADGR